MPEPQSERNTPRPSIAVGALTDRIGMPDPQARIKQVFPALTVMGYEKLNQLTEHLAGVWDRALFSGVDARAGVTPQNVVRLNPDRIHIESSKDGIMGTDALLGVIRINPNFIETAPFRVLAFAARHELGHILEDDAKTHTRLDKGVDHTGAPIHRPEHPRRLYECRMDWIGAWLAETPEQGLEDLEMTMDYLAADEGVRDRWQKAIAEGRKPGHPHPKARARIAERGMKALGLT